jgi:DNA repair protein RecN (Recombination protein N)
MLRELSGILDDAKEWEAEAESISIQIQELTKNVSDYARNIDADQNNLQELDDRMTLLHSLKRKYGETIPDILEFHSKAKERFDDLNSRGARIAEINTLLEKTTKKIVKTGAELSKERSGAAIDLGKAITKELHNLGFEHGSFTVNLESTEPGPNGMDDIEFGFAPNVGEPSRPLRAIASSGEISRVMLATKAVLAKHDKIPILVFDEIDSNVGGEMGNAIGKKLVAVASNHQVLCITHLPQVAVHGTNHLVVSKAIQDKRTRTQIKKVTEDDRVEEVARMLGGKDLTSVTVDHAREMLMSVRF